MGMPKPGPRHLKLEKLAGLWEGEETMHPSQWDPEGSMAKGRTLNRSSLNGFAIISDYEQLRDGVVTFTGHGVYSYDPKKELYRLDWFDCMGSPPEVFTGRFDGEVLILGHGGPGMHARMTSDFSEAGVLYSKMEMSDDGADWTTMFESRYRKD